MIQAIEDEEPRGGLRFIVLSKDRRWAGRLDRAHTLLCSGAADMRRAIERATRDSLWIASASGQIDTLLAAVGAFVSDRHRSCRALGSLLMLVPPRAECLPSLHSCFTTIVGEVESFRMLPLDQLADVLSAPDDEARELLIGGVVDEKSGTLAVVRGNLDRLVVPLSIFRPSGAASPEFQRLAFDDYGHTVHFGDYEATADVILYEVDPDYRKRLSGRRRAEEQGFGAALRRLRKQRGLRRDQFPGLSAKTVARIERGETAAPRGRTLQLLAKPLGVAPEEVATY